MDKRHSETNGKRSNDSSGNRKPHTADKASDNASTASLKLKNNQVLQPGAQKGGNNSHHNQKSSGKKTKKNTGHVSGQGSGPGSKSTGSGAGAGAGSKSAGSGLATSAVAPSKKKAGPVLLGMPDSPMEGQEDTDPYVTKIGGVPVSSKRERYGINPMHLILTAIFFALLYYFVPCFHSHG